MGKQYPNISCKTRHGNFAFGDENFPSKNQPAADIKVLG